MFKCVTYFVKTAAQLGRRNIDNAAVTGALCISLRNIHITSSAGKQVRRMEGSSKKVVVGHDKWKDAEDGDKEIANIDMMAKSEYNLFPNSGTPEQLFDEVPFKELPILFIKATPNNTLMVMTDYKGGILCWNTCGLEGFKNCRKGTNVAAQQTATTLSTKACKEGYSNVRVLVQGIGPGRLSALKGVEIGGLKIVSITDNTRVSWCPPKPRKRRRL